MKQNRFINCERGASGGYTFQKDPKEISLKEMMWVMHGPIVLVQRVSLNIYEKCDEFIRAKKYRFRIITNENGVIPRQKFD